MPSSRLWRVLLALLLLAALFCVPSLVLTGSEWLPELTGAVENYEAEASPAPANPPAERKDPAASQYTS